MAKMPIFGQKFEKMASIRNIKVSWIIHIFAFLHAATAFGCRHAGLEDELLLTILTMTMALMICLKKTLRIEFTAAIIIVVNIIGYFLGNLGADIFLRLISSSHIAHAISTFLTTEIIGWGIVTITKLFQYRQNGHEGKHHSPYLSWIILAMGAIFIFRLGIILIFSTQTFTEGNAIETSERIFSNSFSMIILICLNILYVRYTDTLRKRFPHFNKILILVTFVIAATLIETIMAGLVLTLGDTEQFVRELPILFISSLLAEITVYCIIFMINYAITARHEMHREREKANTAQYRYIKLKHQVNPHFLFNSLNILDCLICEEQTDRASSYTHKLAGVYRYMLKSEEEMIVSLRDELVFTDLYVDLLKERFPKGFIIERDVPESSMARYVLTCSIQLLIENAIKHNTVDESNPLKISIYVQDDNIIVRNNVVPKLTQVPSTGLGQKYIRQMYLDLTGKQIGIESTDQIYTVTLPLI